MLKLIESKPKFYGIFGPAIFLFIRHPWLFTNASLSFAENRIVIPAYDMTVGIRVFTCANSCAHLCGLMCVHPCICSSLQKRAFILAFIIAES